MNSTEKLLKMKEKIDRAENEEARLQGRLTEKFEGMKREFSIDNLETAEAELKKMDDDLSKKEKVQEESIDELWTAYPWETSNAN